MKKLIVAVILLFVGTTGFSQGIDLGVKGGLNFSNVTNIKSLGIQSKTGFHAGVFVGIKFSGKIGIQADLLYSQQGAKLNAGDFDLTYVNVPVVLKYYLVDGIGFNIQAGPQFGFLVEDDITKVVNNIEQKIKANESDVSGVIGMGYDFPIGLRLDARYHIGFNDISDFEELKDGKNKFISIGLGYSFL
jgi:hypothetical protein